MFDSLSDKLQETFRKLRGQARLSEANISEAMREIRLALLEADVNLKVAKDFIDTVKADCVGQEVIKSITPGQQVVKIVNDQLVKLMGEGEVPLNLPSTPTVIMMVGLHGSGKTTTSAKLALSLKKQKKKVMLVAGDVYRPAAIDQLEVLGREIDIPVYSERGNPNVAQIAANAVEEAKFEHIEVVIVDTAGRLQIDQDMVQELVRVSQASRAEEILLVADAALGQEAVSVADHFHKALGLTGLVLTKLDGDARGGAALSIRKVTGCPVKFIGTGEKVQDLEIFYPDRMASRILGMGDVVSLVEKAAEEIDIQEAEKLKKKLKKNQFDFNDFLAQIKQISKLGGAESILKMLPGGRDMSKAVGSIDSKHFNRIEAIILSMTPHERENPDSIDFSRRKRIAKGSGNSLEQVSGLVKQFNQMRKMMKKTGLLSRMFGGGGGGGGAGMGGFGDMATAPGGSMAGLGLGPAGLSKEDKDKKRHLAKLKKKQKKKNRRK
ncbi:MAG: signal recognition particle protein [Lentisphaerae bacterium]|nr:signal recognition particle protein [Lentisphaerota bacterium]MCP4102808.1 signal recognition particle protein [Lentisphaerota bacterium]